MVKCGNAVEIVFVTNTFPHSLCFHTETSFKVVCFQAKRGKVFLCHKKYQARLQCEPGMQYGFMITIIDVDSKNNRISSPILSW